ncbi:MAG: hypothetical protein HY833_03640 [Candidatus Aenigmarchaeota archaeon]|nr:hypothetical protein [Candidatus Aenigmarchaeota archaeon]
MKLAYFAIGLLFLAVLPSASLAQSSDASVKFEVLKYDPSPAEAGELLELWLAVGVVGNTELRNYVVEVVPDFPFLLATDEDAKRRFSVIDSNGVVAKYRIRVDGSALDGDSVLRVKYYPDGSSSQPAREVTISILGKVNVQLSSAQPDTLIPGRPTKVKFLFKNDGNAPVRDLAINWTDPDAGILPLAGENRQRIDFLGVGDEREVEFSMIADPQISQGVHVINLNMEFLRFGESTSRTSSVAFIVGGVTEFDVTQDEVSEDAVSLSIANIGVNTATGVLVSVPEQSGWEINGASDAFLGNLQSGDFTVASVDVVSLSQAPKQTLRVLVKYTDTVGIRQTMEAEVPINLDKSMGKSKKDDSSQIYIILVIVAVIALGVAHFKFRVFNKTKKR